MPEIPDRRKTGAQVVTITGGNGGSQTTYQVSVQRARAWVGLLASIIGLLAMIGGGVWAGVKLGVTSQVHTAIEAECDPDGMIHDQIEKTSMEYIGEVQGVIQDDLDFLEGRLDDVEMTGAELKAGQNAIADQQNRNQAELKMLIQRAIDDGGGG